ncbi:MAG: hypothetical protein B7Y39_04435 [Bdellovibrio sp. 28-41-41]|nr:MAG: hypothetical protein B7Y39_04435 [Bdellovibrio sp. 28-41-41]
MKTSVIEVRDMLSVLSVIGVEKIIGKVAGVESVTVNFAAGSATVRYDETSLKASEIKAAVHQLGSETEESDPKLEKNDAPGSVSKEVATSPPPEPIQAKAQVEDSPEARTTTPANEPPDENAKTETPKVAEDSKEHSH